MTRRARRSVLAVAAALLVVTVIALAARHQTPTGLERVRAALGDNGRFVNGPTAGATLASASQWLLDDGSACASKRGDHDPRCGARLSASAYTGVAAVGVASCTAPGVYRTRAALVAYIDAIETFDRRPLGTTQIPSPPSVPTC